MLMLAFFLRCGREKPLCVPSCAPTEERNDALELGAITRGGSCCGPFMRKQKGLLRGKSLRVSRTIPF
jgi:hypothetical protein